MTLNPLLRKILDTKTEEVACQKLVVPFEDIKHRSRSMPPVRPFAGGVLACASRHRVVAEIKRISPGNGHVRTDFEPAMIAKSYEAAGAAALSVLTDTVFFGGSLTVLALARQAVSLPVLRKDFILEPYQIYEARAYGADAVLLMALAFESKNQFQDMIGVAHDAGVETLLEVHGEAELDYLPTARQSVGINNRDFRDPDLKVDIGTTKRMVKHVGNARLIVSESGIRSSVEMTELERAGVDAFLIGTSLMKRGDPGDALRELLAH